MATWAGAVLVGDELETVEEALSSSTCSPCLLIVYPLCRTLTRIHVCFSQNYHDKSGKLTASSLSRKNQVYTLYSGLHLTVCMRTNKQRNSGKYYRSTSVRIGRREISWLIRKILVCGIFVRIKSNYTTVLRSVATDKVPSDPTERPRFAHTKGCLTKWWWHWAIVRDNKSQAILIFKPWAVLNKP